VPTITRALLDERQLTRKATIEYWLVVSSSRAHAARVALMDTLQVQANAYSTYNTRTNHDFHAPSKHNLHAIFMYFFIKQDFVLEKAHRFPVYSGVDEVRIFAKSVPYGV
jgi:hypothetical protein